MKKVFCILCVLCGSLCAQDSLRVNPGVKINSGVRIRRAVTTQQVPALAQPIVSAATAPAFARAQTAGNLNVVIIGWADATRSITAVTDDASNTYAVAAATTTYTIAGASLRQAIYYAKNIAAHAAGNTVHVTWDGTPTTPDVRILEFSGLDTTSPLDQNTAKGGTYTCTTCTQTTVLTDMVTTGSASELLLAGGMTSWAYAFPGGSFTGTVDASNNLAEYRTVTEAGSYAADAALTAHSQNWLLSFATFKAAGQTQTAPTPTLTGVAPGQGTVAGGTAVTLTGTGFAPGATVTFGGSSATNVVVVSDTQITASTPAHDAGLVDVTVTNPGAAPATLTSGYAYGVKLTIALNPPTGGSVTDNAGRISCPSNCAVYVASGTTITLTPTAASGYNFTGWGANDCDSRVGNTCTLNMGTADWTVTANFAPVNAYLITVVKSPSQGGTVQGQPPHSEINCGSACSYSYPSGTVLVLKATAASGYNFTSWTGCDIPSGDTCTLNIGPAPWTVTANFSSTGSPDYYVDGVNGSDSNPGTAALPWKTIQWAADHASAGKTALVKAGVYHERLNLTHSGGAITTPITLMGEKNGSTFLTAIDPSVCVTHACDASISATAWVPATEVCSGCGAYKRTLAYSPKTLLIGANYQYLFHIAPNHMDGSSSPTGFELLAKAANATIVLDYLGNTAHPSFPIWDGIECMWGTKSGVTYIRFRNGDDPNTKALYAAADGYVVNFAGSYNTLKNFWIRGSYKDVAINSAAAAGNIVDSSRIDGATRPFEISAATNFMISNNDISLNYYGTGDFGEWELAPGNPPNCTTAYTTCLHAHEYAMFKRYAGPNELEDEVAIWDLGGSDTVAVMNNYIHQMPSGIFGGWGSWGTQQNSNNWQISNNTLDRFSSNAINIQSMAVYFTLSNNLIERGNENLRFQGLAQDSSTTPREVYVFNNLFWLKDGLGMHLYAHSGGSGTAYGKVWLYHNSFAGGGGGLGIAIGQGLPNWRFINNVFSDNTPLFEWTGGANVIGTQAKFGFYAYSWLGHGYVVPAWKDGGNKYSSTNIWNDSSALPSFDLPATGTGSDALHTGMDVSKTFNIGGTNYPALPGMQTGYFTGAAPNMGATQ